MCDNTSTIIISKNLILYSRTTYIEIRYHFIRDHIERCDVKLVHVDIKYWIADVFMKTLSTQQHRELKFKFYSRNMHA
jgi:bifunctional DNase/RNase